MIYIILSFVITVKVINSIVKINYFPVASFFDFNALDLADKIGRTIVEEKI